MIKTKYNILNRYYFFIINLKKINSLIVGGILKCTFPDDIFNLLHYSGCLCRG
jgi:hypothetical protein